MSFSDTINRIIDEYIDECRKIMAEASPADGLLGLWNDPGKNPCHEAFMKKLEEETRHMADASVDSAEAYSVTCILLKAAFERECPEIARWTLLSAHRATLPLIPILNHEQRNILREWYDSHVSRRDRFPVQNAVYKSLKQ